MPKTNAAIVSFNHGEVSKLALARVDLQRMKFAAEIQTNFVPRTVGPMALRGGLEFLEATKNNAYMVPIPFVFAHDDTAIIEMTTGAMRVRVDDELVTVTSVSGFITDPEFTIGGGSGWDTTSGTTSGATATIVTSPGYLELIALALGSVAVCRQAVNVPGADINQPHRLRIEIGAGSNLGAVVLKIGTTADSEDVLEPILLEAGSHSIAFTPTTTIIWIQFESRARYPVYVTSCDYEAAGTLEITTPYALDALDLLRWTQSGDVIYLACGQDRTPATTTPYYESRKIVRRDDNSWSLVRYIPVDGPFKSLATATVLLTPGRTYGITTLQADRPFFTSLMEGSLIRLTQTSQYAQADLADDDTYTEPIRISGVHDPNPNALGGQGRTFTVVLSGTYSGQVTLQRSFDGPDLGYADIETYASGETSSSTYLDEFDNSIAWYRLGFLPGAYGSGTVNAVLQYPAGGGSGVAMITSVSTTQLANINVLEPFASHLGTKDWQEGEWSQKYGYPSAVTLHEGRLWWFGRDRVWGSVSDAYQSFSVDVEGDAASIQRSIGYGPVERIQWALPLQRLIIGTGSSEVSIRSSSFDEPLSPSNFGMKDASTQGCAPVDACKVDSRGVFVTRSKRRLYQLMFSMENGDYSSNDLTALLPDIASNIVKVGVQRHPDTRIHCILADGTAKILLYEPGEEVICWYTIETDGLIETLCVLPEDKEDAVYYVVKRTINGSTVRYIEKVSQIDVQTGQPAAYLADSHHLYTGGSTTVQGLDHLEGETVVVWAWDDDDDSGTDFGTLGAVTPTYTVSGGTITIPTAKDNVLVGLPYTAQFKSAKLAYAAGSGSALTQKKRIDHVGLILKDVAANRALRFGQTFQKMDTLPLLLDGLAVTADQVIAEHDKASIGLPGTWDTDSRLCLEAKSPRPCTVLGAVISITTNDKI
jgi:hypothetical protein